MGLEAIYVPLLIASTAVGAYSSIQASKAAKQAGEANYVIGEQQAVVHEQQAQVETDAIRERNRRLAASQRTSFLKSGITLDGTASDVIYDSAIQGELEALTTLYQGSVAANFSRKDAALSRFEGKMKSRAYKYEAAGTILNGVGNALSVTANPAFGRNSRGTNG